MAAGEGKRMRPLTETRPKPLVEVAGKPIIEYVLEALPPEVDEIIIVIGYKGQMIKDRLGDSYNGIPIRYVHQWMAAGTAHALSMARPLLKGKFMFLNADDILGKEALAEAVKHPLAILVATHERPEIMGVIELREDGTLNTIEEKPEKPKSNLVNTNTMVLDERVFSYDAKRHPTGEYYIVDPVSLLAQDHPIKVIQQPIYIPVGYPEDISKAEARLKELGI